MSIQLIKMKQGRKRFIKTLPIADFDNWQFYLTELKKFISLESSFQIVDNHIYFQVNSENEAPKLMLEVIGPPFSIGPNSFGLLDLDESEVLVHRLSGFDLFTIDSSHLLKTAIGLKMTLDNAFSKKSDNLSPIFHIVFNQNKIELHFFSQKDYIQK